MRARLELHEHCYISGPNARCAGTDRGRLIHSHEGGDRPHVHEDEIHRTGPGSYTIDSMQWARATGMRGGGKKRFTGEPTGPQLPLQEVEPPQIRVVIVGDGGASVAGENAGAGEAPLLRMMLGMKAQVASVEHCPARRRRG
ncbi:MAG TPA: hypothetical protein VFS67_29710 [Polyangiaceae bacterium]|nr:hypothetical protein [Polyangiaceae bacterium]